MCTCMSMCTSMFVYVCINTCVCLPFLWNCNFFLDDWQQNKLTKWDILVGASLSPRRLCSDLWKTAQEMETGKKQESVPSTLWVQLRMLAVRSFMVEIQRTVEGRGDECCLSIRSAESKHPQLSIRPREGRWFAGRHYQTLTLNLRSNDITTSFLPPVNL